MGKRKNRTSVSRYLNRVFDATEDFIEDVLESAEDVECDMRRSLGRALEGRDDEDEDGRERSEHEEVRRLRAELADLTARIERMTAERR